MSAQIESTSIFRQEAKPRVRHTKPATTIGRLILASLQGLNPLALRLMERLATRKADKNPWLGLFGIVDVEYWAQGLTQEDRDRGYLEVQFSEVLVQKITNLAGERASTFGVNADLITPLDPNSVLRIIFDRDLAAASLNHIGASSENAKGTVHFVTNLPENIFSSFGETWTDLSKVWMRAFNHRESQHMIASHGPIVVQEAMQRLQKTALSGKKLDVTALSHRVAADLFCLSVFPELKDKLTDDVLADIRSAPNLVFGLGVAGKFIDWKWLRWLLNAPFQAGLDRLDQVFQASLIEVEQNPYTSTPFLQDILASLQQYDTELQADVLFSHLFTAISAGTDTTAHALVQLIEVIMTDAVSARTVRSQLVAEFEQVFGVEHCQQLTEMLRGEQLFDHALITASLDHTQLRKCFYLKAVCDEAMRMASPVAFTFRQPASAATELIAIRAILNNPDDFPLGFMPERHIKPERYAALQATLGLAMPATEQATLYHQAQQTYAKLTPFGATGSENICKGFLFAPQEISLMAIVLSLSPYELQLAGRPTRIPGIVQGQDKVKVKVKIK